MNLREGRIGLQEAVCAAALSLSAKAVFIRQDILSDGGNGLWQSCLLSVALTLGLLLMVFALLRRTGAPGLTEAFRIALGPFFGAAAALLLAAAQFFGAVFLAENFLILLRHYVMVNTPDWFLALFLLAGALPLAWMGLEAITRTSKILLPLFCIALAITLFGAASGFSAYRLFPLLGPGSASIGVRSVQQTFFWSDALLLTALPVTLQNRKTLRNASVSSALLGGGIALLCLLAVSLSFAYPLLAKISAPIYKLSGVARSQHLRRLAESMPFVWLSAVLCAAGWNLYHAARLHCRVFSIQNIRAVLPAFAATLYFAVLIFSAEQPWSNRIFFWLKEWGWTFLALPIVLSVLFSLIKRRTPHETPASSPRGA